jgi:hypothetical protein
VIFVKKSGKIYNPRKMVQKRIKEVRIGLIFDLTTNLGMGNHRVSKNIQKKTFKNIA